MVKYLALVLVLAQVLLAVSGLYLYTGENTSTPLYFYSPRLTYYDPPAAEGYWDSQIIDGEIIIANVDTPRDNLTGKIVINAYNAGAWGDHLHMVEDTLRALSGTGIKALFIVRKLIVPGCGNWAHDGTHDQREFPVFEIIKESNDSIASLLDLHGPLNASIPFEANKWDVTFHVALPIIGAFINVYSGITAVIAIYKLLVSIMTYGPQMSIAQVVLSINIIGCVLRIIQASADCFGDAMTTNWVFVQVFLTITFPINVGNALLISLYWHEMIHKKINKSDIFVTKLKWLFVAIMMGMIIFEISTSVLRGLNISFSIVVYLDGAMYVLVYAGVLIFFILTRMRLQKIIDKLNASLKQGDRGTKLSIATFHVQGMVVCTFFWLVLIIIIAISTLPWAPVNFPVLWGLLFAFHMTSALFQVLLIRAPTRSWKWIFCGLCMSSDELDMERFGSSAATSQMPMSTLSTRSRSKGTASTHSGKDSVESMSPRS